MRIGVVADDFTGASDIALTLAEQGMRTAQVIGVPERDNLEGLDAAVVALKSRTAPVDNAVAQSLAAADWLIGQGAEQIVFKVCSTFDSTPEGNIGPVLDALADRLDEGQVMVCPAFPEAGRSVYQAHLFVGDRLLNESGMQDHPLTPMTDADLRRILGVQSTREIAHIPMAIVARGGDAIVQALPDRPVHVIVDAIHDNDLMEIGRAAKGRKLVCGGSGIALGLPASFGAVPKTPAWNAVTGPGVVLSGSCSRATRAQVAAYRDIAPAREISAEAAVSGQLSAAALADWALAQETSPLVYSSADPDTVRAAQDRFGSDRAAQCIERLFADLAAALADRGVRRMVVAGGETSGAVVSGLKARLLHVGPRLAAGVPVLKIGGSIPMALALKSGNFGAADFFEHALQRMEVSV